MKLLRTLRVRGARVLPGLLFRSSASYWETRYARGGNSGSGSYGRQAEYKAAFLNSFVMANDVRTVIEFGCGDGSQLRRAEYPAYLGIDVSPTAIRMCADAFRKDQSKSFFLYCPDAYFDPARFIHGDAALSLDVLFHLVEDEVFESYLRSLFNAADRFVVIYGSDRVARSVAPHVRHRKFTSWVDEHFGIDWELLRVEPAPTGGYQDFHVFARRASQGGSDTTPFVLRN